MSSPTSKSHVDRGSDYVARAIGGDPYIGKWARLACERHQRDLEKSKSDDWPYQFDEVKAERVCRFMSRLPHVKGEWARKQPDGSQKRIHLEDWQCFIVMSLFGWVKKESGYRRFRSASLYVSRKNAKSTLAAGIGWWMFGKDGEPGAEVYPGATSLKQAMEVFRPARQMALKVPALASELGVTVKMESLLRAEDDSRFEPIVGKPGDGSSPHCAIIDEYHEHDTSDLHDTMETGMGARTQPLKLIISTAGTNVHGPCRDDWKSCEQLLEGIYEDDTKFALIYTVDNKERWYEEAEIRKANPNYGVSIYADEILTQIATARRESKQTNKIKTKRLNIWTSALDGYFDTDQFIDSGDSQITLDDFAGMSCWMGGDFAAKRDLMATIKVFDLPDKSIAVFGRYYLPRSAVERDSAPHYRQWEREGWLTVAEGNTNDFEQIEKDLIADNSRFKVEEFAYDPSRSGEAGTIQNLMKAGVNCVDMRSARDRPNAVFNLLSEPMKRLDGLIRDGRVIHCCDPVMAWAICNTVTKEDHLARVYPRKEGDQNKIDPVVALLNALARKIIRQEYQQEETNKVPTITFA